MPAPSLKKDMLLEAGWLRELCSESISASCPSCGSPIDLASGDSSDAEKECWVCTWKGTPAYQCAKCSQPRESPCEAERECKSVSAFESMALVAFQPEGEVWFHRKNTSGKTHIAIDSTLRDELRSGSLPSSTQVCKSGEDKFIEAVDHPSFSGLFPEHASPALPPPLPPAPTPPHLPVGSKNPIIATLLAILFGPLGLLYLSWKVSAVTFLLHIVCSAIFGWSNWAGILFWHILPTAIAYWISRKVNNLSQFLGLIRSDAVLAFSLLKKIFLTRLGYWSSTIIFATGFIFSGSFVTKKWITELDWLAILFYSILLLYTTRISFNLSKRYIFSIKTSTTVYFSYPVITDSEILRKYLQWSAFCLLTFVTFILWKDNPGIVRLLLIAGAISIPFLNFMRGAVGAFGLGCLGGWVALIAKSIIESIYLFIMK